MRSIITILLLCVTSLSYAARVDKTLEVDPDGQVRIEVIDGDVTIIGWDKSEIRVEGRVPDGEDTFVFKTNGGETRIEIESKNGFWGRSKGGASLTIYTPENSSIRGEGASVEFDIKDILGAVNASTMSGDITLEGGRGKVDISTVSGDVSVKDAKGKLNLSSVSGDIDADAQAQYFDAQTVSGDIEAQIGSSDRVELESVSGNIELRFLLEEDGRLDADTVSGNIDIEFLNDELNASFDIETGPGGDVTNRLSRDRSESRSSFSGSLSFKLGSGDSSVNLETMSGTIEIDR